MSRFTIQTVSESQHRIGGFRKRTVCVNFQEDMHGFGIQDLYEALKTAVRQFITQNQLRAEDRMQFIIEPANTGVMFNSHFRPVSDFSDEELGNVIEGLGKYVQHNRFVSANNLEFTMKSLTCRSLIDSQLK